MQCIFTAGWAAALCRESSDQRSAYSFHQWQKPENSGRGGERARRTNYHPRGLCSLDIQESLHVFRGRWGGLYVSFGGNGRHLLSWKCAPVQAWKAGLFGRCHSSYLLVVAQLIVQDDAVGLLRLWPRQGEAVHGGADLVHDGNNGGRCTVGEKGQKRCDHIRGGL